MGLKYIKLTFNPFYARKVKFWQKVGKFLAETLCNGDAHLQTTLNRYRSTIKVVAYREPNE